MRETIWPANYPILSLSLSPLGVGDQVLCQNDLRPLPPRQCLGFLSLWLSVCVYSICNDVCEDSAHPVCGSLNCQGGTACKNEWGVSWLVSLRLLIWCEGDTWASSALREAFSRDLSGFGRHYEDFSPSWWRDSAIFLPPFIKRS